MSKRPSLKGKGADIFLNDLGSQKEQPTSKPARQHTSTPAHRSNDKSGPLVKATFYLLPDNVDALDDFWMRMRKTAKNKKISKSYLVSLLISKAFHDLRGNSDEKVLEILRLQ